VRGGGSTVLERSPQILWRAKIHPQLHLPHYSQVWISFVLSTDPLFCHPHWGTLAEQPNPKWQVNLAVATWFWSFLLASFCSRVPWYSVKWLSEVKWGQGRRSKGIAPLCLAWWTNGTHKVQIAKDRSATCWRGPFCIALAWAPILEAILQVTSMTSSPRALVSLTVYLTLISEEVILYVSLML
jgi:hypothetical protein